MEVVRLHLATLASGTCSSGYFLCKYTKISVPPCASIQQGRIWHKIQLVQAELRSLQIINVLPIILLAVQASAAHQDLLIYLMPVRVRDADGNLVNPLPVTVGPGNGEEISAAAALAYQGSNTSAGPDGGNLACAWAVNNVLAQAGIPPIDGNNFVDQMQTQLDNGRGTEVTQATAQPGDIVIENNDTMSHVGICINVGCTQVLSNSSSKATFSSISDATMGTGIAPDIYHVNH